MSNLPVVNTNTAALQGMFNESKVEETAGGGLSFLNFDAKRTGEWLYGAAGESVTDEVIAVDVATLMHGQIQWHRKKCSRRMVAINQPMPEEFEPIEYTGPKGKIEVDESQDGRSFEATFVDGVRFLYEVSTHGGRKAIDSVLTQLRARAAQGNPFFFPHVRLATSSYQHSSYGLVFVPELEVVAWYDGEGNLEESQEKLAAPAPKKKSAPKRRAAVEAAPEPTPEIESAATEPEQETAPAPEEAAKQDAPPKRRTRKPAAA